MQYHPQKHIPVGGDSPFICNIRTDNGKTLASFGDLSKSMTNNKALKGQPVLVPTVSENSLLSSFPDIT